VDVTGLTATKIKQPKRKAKEATISVILKLE
jgi:hypothetical protein